MLKYLLLKHLEGKVMRRCLTGLGAVVLRVLYFWRIKQSSPFRKAQLWTAIPAFPKRCRPRESLAVGSSACGLQFPPALTHPSLGPPSRLQPPTPGAVPVPRRGHCLSQEGFCVPQLPGGWKGKHGRTVRRNKWLDKHSTVGYRKQQNWKSHPQMQQATGWFPNSLFTWLNGGHGFL